MVYFFADKHNIMNDRLGGMLDQLNDLSHSLITEYLTRFDDLICQSYLQKLNGFNKLTNQNTSLITKLRELFLQIEEVLS